MKNAIKKQRQKHTNESLRIEALKYGTKRAFEEGNSGAYVTAKSRGKEFFDSICGHMTRTQVHTLDSMREEALKYINKRDFRQNNTGAYQMARRESKDFFDSICEHMTPPPRWRIHTEESLRLEALKYTTRNDFVKGSKGAYTTAREISKEFLNSICSHMEVLVRTYNEDSLRFEASKHAYRVDFQNEGKGAYGSALSRGKEFLDSICAHMDTAPRPVTYTEEVILAEALKYRTRTDFDKYSRGAYVAASRKGEGYLDYVCAHMDASVAGSSHLSRKWLEELSKEKGIFIQHKLNGGEVRIEGTRYYADGYCKETNTVYEFYGDRWHGNLSVYTPDETPNPFDSNKTAKQLYDATIVRENKIKALGYNLVVIWESEYRKQRKVA